MRKRDFGIGFLCGISFVLGLAAGGITKAPITGTLGDLNGIASKIFWRLDGKNPPTSAITWNLPNVTLKVYRIETTGVKTRTLQFSPALSASEESALISPENDGTLYFLDSTSGLSFGHIENNDSFHWGMIADGVDSQTQGLRGIVESVTGTVGEWINRG